MMQHIAMGTAASPYVSLSRSYAVAWHYAVMASGTAASVATPAYVYEIEIDPPAPVGLTLIDPVQHLSSAAPGPLSPIPYHHDGLPDFLHGVMDSRMGHYLSQLPPCPPVGGATTRSHPAHASDELKTLVCALRDAEVLAVGTIPVSCMRNRYDVY